MNIISGWQRREYTQMGIWPGAEHYRRRYDYCAEYVTIMKELWETGRSDFKGDFFQMDDCRCLPMPTAKIPIICAAQSDNGTRFAAQYADYNFCGSFGVNAADRASRPASPGWSQATQETGRNCGALVLTMIIADETDAAAMAKWEHYKAGTDRRGAGLSRRAGRGRSQAGPVLAGRTSAGRLGIDKLPTNQGVLVGSYAIGRAHAGRAVDGAGRARRDADLRRFRHRHGAVRHAHHAADALPRTRSRQAA